MSTAHAEPTVRQPYPGLRPFRDDESDLFFGRERQTDDLLGRLQRRRFIAVTGPSGCGKSSLIKAGVVPALLGGLMGDAGARWRVAQMRPGDSPLRALAKALAVPEIVGAAAADAAGPDYVEAALRFGPLGLAQVVREAPPLQNAALFLLVDQFEEIFRFRERIDPDEADAFVRLLLETSTQPDLRVYVVITMRSDYLGDCTVFAGLPETINDGQYLTPRLTRDECAMAIRGPARVCGGDVDAALVNRLLNDFGPDPDQLPLLQHSLMRMWRRRGAAPPTPDRVVLTVDDYVERLGEALDRHAEEVYAALAPEQQRMAEVMFRRLTERARGKRDTRAPAQLGEVAAIAGVDAATLAPVVEAFRREGCNFVVAGDGPLEALTLLDIGHESLIRQWKRLAGWVDAEAESAAIYLRLAGAARRHAGGEGALLWEPDLQQALGWLARDGPSEPWAARYHGPADPGVPAGAEFRRMVAFLDDSRAAWEAYQERKRQREAEERQREIDQGRQEADMRAARADADRAVAELALERSEKLAAGRRRRNFALGGMVGVLMLAVLGLWGWDRYREWTLATTTQTYANFVSVRGIPTGLGPPLTTQQVSRRSASYEIRTRCRQPSGWVGNLLDWLDTAFDSRLRSAGGLCPAPRVVEMRAVNGFGELATDHSAQLSALSGDEEAPEARRPVRWEYVYDEEGRVAHEVEFDRGGRRLRSLVYLPANRGDVPTQRTRHVSGPDGFPLPHAKNICASAETVEFSPEGYDWRYRYKDRFGRPVPGPDHVPVQERRHDDRGFLLEFVSLAQRGDELVPVNDAVGNSAVRYAGFDDFGNARVHEYLGADGALVDVKGYAVMVFDFDDAGNHTQVWRFNHAGRPAEGTDGWHRWDLRYGQGGLVAEESFWAADGSPATQGDFCHQLRWSYDGRGRRTSGVCIGTDGRPSPGSVGAPMWRIAYDAADNDVEWSYWDASGEKPAAGRRGWHRLVRTFDERSNVRVERYLDVNGKPARMAKGYSEVRMGYDGRDNTSRYEYRGPDGQRMLISGGYSVMDRAYDENGNVISERYFGADGETPAPHAQGYVGVDFRHDACGRETDRRYVGPDGKPTLTAAGEAGAQLDHDDLGRETGWTFVDAGGQPTLLDSGVAGWHDQLDRFGRVEERRYLGPAGKPIADDKGEAGWRQTFDAHGHVVREVRIGLTGQPVASRTVGEARVARIDWVRDALGRKVKEAYFGVRGEPVYVAGGYARVRRSFGPSGEIAEESFLGADGSAVPRTDGAHRIHFARDAHGAIVSESYHGLQGEPVDSTAGYHRIEFTRDVHGRETGRRFFDVAGQPAVGPDGWHERRDEIDPLGRLVARSFWGTDGKPGTPAGSAYHALGWRFDRLGRVLERHYLDARQHPVTGPEGAPVVVWGYDGRGRTIEQTFLLAPAGALTLQRAGYAKVRYQYDDRGRLIEEAFLGIDGSTPVNSADGHARRQVRYVPEGRVEAFWRADETLGTGRGTLQKPDYAFLATRLDGFGRAIETWYLHADRTPAGAGNGWWARRVAEYDDRGRETAVTYQSVGPGGKLTFDHRIRLRYDRLGRLEETRVVGTDDRLMRTHKGVSRTTYRYDVHGWLVEERWYDEGDRPTGVSSSEAVGMHLSYDARGHETLRRYFGKADDQPAFAQTPAGRCVALSWQRDPVGRSPTPEGVCLGDWPQPQRR